jgi:hypothetical protein
MSCPGGTRPLVDFELVVTIAIPLLVPVVAYLMNSRAQRQFEKRKTAYHQKLKAFAEMNDRLIYPEAQPRKFNPPKIGN